VLAAMAASIAEPPWQNLRSGAGNVWLVATIPWLDITMERARIFLRL
jgi:hypothetical protein